jgi:glutamine amidotransferase
VNADGWGVGFYADDLDRPARWRSNRPLWSDVSFHSVAPTIVSGCVVGAVRSATVGMPLDESACAPFWSGSWLLSHNGVIDRDVLGAQAGAESACDSAQLAACIFARGPEHLGKLVTEFGLRDPRARLNVLVTNGVRVLATTWGDTLSVRRTDAGVLVASEPFDDDAAWIDIPDRCLVDVDEDHMTITDLKD